MIRRWLLPALLLAGCGYHLTGSGGAIPTAARTIVVLGDTPTGQKEAALLRARLTAGADRRFVAAADGPHATLLIRGLEETWRATDFDSSGIANRYRMELRGALRLRDLDGKTAWRSGPIGVAEELFASGGPTATETERAEVRRRLRARWADEAANRLRSGF